MQTIRDIRKHYRHLNPVLDERGRRIWAASEALRLGRGGISRISKATGLSRTTIYAGIRDLQEKADPGEGRIRRPGAGRKRLSAMVPDLKDQLESLVEPMAKGDPMSPLRWTCRSTRDLAEHLQHQGTEISHATVSRMLHEMGYSLQGNRKAEEGRQHPDRDRQFRHINRTVASELSAGNPVISVDTKKKELVGNFQNAGTRWRPKRSAERVNGHDFPSPDVPRAYPYGSI